MNRVLTQNTYLTIVGHTKSGSQLLELLGCPNGYDQLEVHMIAGSELSR